MCWNPLNTTNTLIHEISYIITKTADLIMKDILEADGPPTGGIKLSFSIQIEDWK